jgi:hypothetical protein
MSIPLFGLFIFIQASMFMTGIKFPVWVGTRGKKNSVSASKSLAWTIM